MAKKDFGNMMVKDLPQPGQRWRLKNGMLVEIIMLSCDDKSWTVGWYYIHDDGSLNFVKSYGSGPTVTCDGRMELGRFLQGSKPA